MARDNLKIGVATAHIRVIECDVRGLSAANHHEGLMQFAGLIGESAIKSFETQPKRATPLTLVQKLINGRFAHVRIARITSSLPYCKLHSGPPRRLYPRSTAEASCKQNLFGRGDFVNAEWGTDHRERRPTSTQYVIMAHRR
ncbi:hypothetical protein [Singulisphaera acidiphila]|uniref:hypothetical protein n=1 Tax=Singulisphaera acidiphila TaxID=466153 RepID=UPI0002F25F6D|nr:hypothetical protein [Singulisphaera acidiphila]